VRIGQPTGSYEGLPANRRYILTVHLPATPQEVRVNGQLLPTAEGDQPGWMYQADNAAVRINLGQIPEGGTEVAICLPSN